MGSHVTTEWAITYEKDEPDGQTPGRRITFTGVEFRPLGFAALAAAKLHQPITIPLDWQNAKVVDTDFEDVEIGKIARVYSTFESPFSSRAVGLVPGGWLPSILAAMRNHTVVMLDRNVIADLLGRFDGGKVRKSAAQDFLNLLADQPFRINPMLYVLEGNLGTTPTPAVVEQQYRHVTAKLQAALPRAEIVVGEESLRSVLDVIDQTRDGMRREQNFLMDVAPLLAAPVARGLLPTRWTQIIAAARVRDVALNSLVVLAALSCAAVPKRNSPAYGVLKFAPGYTESHAYNALADLQSLELLIGAFCSFPDEPLQLCTADKSLALFWTGIGAGDFSRTDNGSRFNLEPVAELLPGAALDDWRAIAGG